MQQIKINRDRFNYLDLWLLLCWFALGILLRLVNLGDKPASSIEIATLGFSLGNGFSQIPLDRLISTSTLLSPLKVDSTINSADVIERLFAESTHPPLYFWLTHWWIKLFTHSGELVSLQIGRSLSAIFGGLSIPAIFGLSWLSFSDRNSTVSNRQRLIAHLAAILMAFSPYGIYLAQEARHYTLSILWIIASVSCLIATIKHLHHRSKIPWWISPVWIVINSLGIATHYFFSLALILEGFVVVGFWFWQRTHSKNQLSFRSWLPLIVVGLGTLAGCLVWLPIASNISGNELTDWIETDYDLDEILLPIPRSLAWLITMIVLLPIEGVPKAIAICSTIVILLGLLWLIPALVEGYKSLSNSSHFSTMLLTSYLVGAVILYLALIYGYGKDVSLAARYHFVYFPILILTLAAILARLWDSATIKKLAEINKQRFYPKGKKVVAAVLVMSLLGSLTVINDFGYQKSRHANRLAAHIQTSSTVPVIVATTYETLSELRELVALALAFETNNPPDRAVEPQFILVGRDRQHDSNLNAILSSRSRPFDLWGVNLKDNETSLNQINCIKDNDARLSDAGYKNRVYHCN